LLATLPPPPARPSLRLLTPPVRNVPAARAAARLEHTLPGPFRMAPREDWTSRIAWVAMGVLGIVAVAAMLGWRPSDQHWRPTASATAPPVPGPQVHDTGAVVTQRLRAAVQAAWQAAPPRSEVARQSLLDELSEMRALQAMQPEAASLTKLARLPDWPAASRQALPAALLAPAPVPWPNDVAEREKVAAAVERSLAVVAPGLR
jgi:hypothetical protein